MMNEAIRIIDAALRSGTYGLAVKLAAMTLESGDTADTLTIYNEMQHGEAARDVLPDGTDHVLILGSGQYNPHVPATKPLQDQSMELVIHGIRRNVDTPAALRQVSYVTLACLQTLASLVTTKDGTTGARNGVGLRDISNIGGGIVSVPNDDVAVTWQLRMTVALRLPS